MKFRPGDKAVYQGITGRVIKTNSDANTLTFRGDARGEAKELSMDDEDLTLLTCYYDLNAQNAFLKTLIGKSFRHFTTTQDSFRLGLNAVEYFELKHEQDCCEEVYIESIDGNPKDLLDSPLTMAEVVSNDPGDGKDNTDNVEQWTFYKFATVKGYVDIRFYGTSNGYYSTGVSLSSNIINKKEDL